MHLQIFLQVWIFLAKNLMTELTVFSVLNVGNSTN